jgi:hypothetical protein
LFCSKVIVSFVATAYTLILLLPVYYLFVFNLLLEPSRPEVGGKKFAEHPNLVEKLVLEKFVGILDL